MLSQVPPVVGLLVQEETGLVGLLKTDLQQADHGPLVDLAIGVALEDGAPAAMVAHGEPKPQVFFATATTPGLPGQEDGDLTPLGPVSGLVAAPLQIRQARPQSPPLSRAAVLHRC